MMARIKDALIRLLVYVTNHVVSHVPSHVLRRGWYRRIGLDVGSGSAIHLGCFVWFYGPGHLRRTGASIGENSIVNRDCCLDVRGPLVIGDNVSISPEVAIITTQHAWREPGFPLETRGVVIEDHAWIGMRATLLPGTTVGRGAIVAAGSVASGDIPPLTVVAGIPARAIARRPPSALDYQLDDLTPLYE